MATKTASNLALRPHFPKGRKEIYLPSFVLTFLRTPFLPATYAKFQVPLSFSKLDIRDYLFHAYNVRVLRVRSFVEQQKMVTGQRNQKSRPKAIKRMTVEMDKPFVWPEEPEEWDDWDKKTHDAANEHSDTANYKSTVSATTMASKKPAGRESIAKQAKRLLEGKEKWKPTWEALGKEGETDDHHRQKVWSQESGRGGES
ncbi:hypothetical protein EJ08DRAFT_682694 [Tothia fuscella]|uniref:Large ribosomal subunit protein uL23m n=1 Tax=Tothia fuscella TaxID=1048955 RepID=A0A9P4TUL4_9PEZI|nr:hypothetical protein EJ08DRAFT_682694 [Tothia fuscella]